jgi:hypothetical protein
LNFIFHLVFTVKIDELFGKIELGIFAPLLSSNFRFCLVDWIFIIIGFETITKTVHGTQPANI